MIDFPSAPATGQVVTAPNGTAWRWNGSMWLLGSAASAAGARGRVGYAQATTNVGGIGTTPTAVGLSVPFTAVAGRTYKFTGDLYALSSVAGDHANIGLYDNVGAQVQSASMYLPGAGLAYRMHLEYVVVAPTSGPLTYNLLLFRSGGSGTVSSVCGGAYPGFLLVEDITYEAGSAGAVVSDTGWLQPSSIQSGWANYSAAYAPASHRLKNGIVFVRAVIVNGTINSWVPLWVVPAGFRPDKVVQFAGTDACKGEVNPDGTIKMNAPAAFAGWNISYPADQ